MSIQQDEEEYGIENIAYDELEREFQSVLINLSSDQSLDRFRVEYEKIHKALKSSHEQEKRLLSKCRQLSKDILAGATKVQSALKLSNDDNQTISYLKAELTKTYKFLELSREHEELSKQKIEKLKAEMKKLQIQMEQNESMAEGQVVSVHEYVTTNEQLTKQKEILQISVQSNQQELQMVKQKIDDNEQLKQKLQRQLAVQIDLKNKEEAKVKEEEKNKRDKKDELERIKSRFDASKQEEARAREQRKRLNAEFKDACSQLHIHEVNRQKEKKLEKKLLKEMELETKKIEEIEGIIDSLSELYMKKEEEHRELSGQLQKLQEKQAELEQVEKELLDAVDKLKAEKLQNEALKETITNGMNQLENEIADEKRNASKDRSFIEKLKRDRDMYQKEIERADTNNKKLEEEILSKEKVIKEKENQIFGQKKEVDRLNKMIEALGKERDAYAFQATSAEAKYFYSRDEVKLRDNFIAEFQKQNLQTEAKLKKQQTLYQAVRSDRNLVSKNLAEMQEQNEQYKRRYKMVSHQISQLKEEIDAKEAELVREHGEHKKKEKKIEEESKKIDRYAKDIKENEEKIKNYNAQIKKLYAIIKESETQKQKLQEQYELVVAERDILGTQLIRRSAEAELLYEKIKINQSTLSKGEAQYRERLTDISTKKEEIANLINQIKTYKIQTNSIKDLKNEIHNLSRELTESKLKVKALSEQLQNPMNVHRWRKLEATDSPTYELMTKIQSVQKRLIMKTEEVQRKEKELEEKVKEYKELEKIVQRQPSIEEEKLIPSYEESLRQKDKQIKAMKAEISAYSSNMEQFKIELERLEKERDTFTKKHYQQKQRQRDAKEAANKSMKEATIQIHLPDKRFTGGGFNLAI